MCRGLRRVTFRPDRFIVHHASPRRLLLSVSQGSARLYFLAIHAPHRGLEAHFIEEWWCETLKLCRDIIGDGECVIAGDCNASLGGVTSHSVSDHHAEKEDQAGALLHCLLQEREVWVPATYEHCHLGQGWTYVQKRNGKHIRPDFVAIPWGWRQGGVTSEVNASIHAGQAAPDHLATTVRVEARLLPSRCDESFAPTACRRFDEEAIGRTENKETVARILSTIPVVDWSVNASEHASVLVNHLQCQLQHHFPLKEQRRHRRHSFLSDATWALHARVARLRCACAACRTHVARHVTASAFLAWKNSRGCLSFADYCFSPWKRQTQQAHAVYCHELGAANVLLRKACAADRADFLRGCAHKANAGQDRAAYQAVRRLLGHKRRKAFAPEVLPCLLGADGTPCDSPLAVADRWRQHFGDLEGPDGLPAALGRAAPHLLASHLLSSSVSGVKRLRA